MMCLGGPSVVGGLVGFGLAVLLGVLLSTPVY